MTERGERKTRAWMSERSEWDWEEVGKILLRPKKQTGDASVQMREYLLLACPLGCGQTVEVLAERASKQRSIVGRAHLSRCPKLVDAQRMVFKPERIASAADCTPVKTKRRRLPAPPPRVDGTSAEEYASSFSAAPQEERRKIVIHE
jgi:hypothetical protein